MPVLLVLLPLSIRTVPRPLVRPVADVQTPLSQQGPLPIECILQVSHTQLSVVQFQTLQFRQAGFRIGCSGSIANTV